LAIEYFYNSPPKMDGKNGWENGWKKGEEIIFPKYPPIFLQPLCPILAIDNIYSNVNIIFTKWV
jgi:hypothetical protein